MSWRTVVISSRCKLDTKMGYMGVCEDLRELTTQTKRKLTNVLNTQVTIGGNSQTVLAAIGIYVRSVFTALADGDGGQIKFYEL